jgi:hypothetical protein
MILYLDGTIPHSRQERRPLPRAHFVPLASRHCLHPARVCADFRALENRKARLCHSCESRNPGIIGVGTPPKMDSRFRGNDKRRNSAIPPRKEAPRYERPFLFTDTRALSDDFAVALRPDRGRLAVLRRNGRVPPRGPVFSKAKALSHDGLIEHSYRVGGGA